MKTFNNQLEYGIYLDNVRTVGTKIGDFSNYQNKLINLQVIDCIDQQDYLGQKRWILLNLIHTLEQIDLLIEKTEDFEINKDGDSAHSYYRAEFHSRTQELEKVNEELKPYSIADEIKTLWN